MEGPMTCSGFLCDCRNTVVAKFDDDKMCFKCEAKLQSFPSVVGQEDSPAFAKLVDDFNEEFETVWMLMTPSQRHYESHKLNMQAYFERNSVAFRENRRQYDAAIRADPTKKAAKKLQRHKYYIENAKPWRLALRNDAPTII